MTAATRQRLRVNLNANGRGGADPNESTLGSRRPAIARWENEGGATLERSAKRVLPKKLVIFDLDGTIAESKAAVDPEMAGLLGALLQIARVAIISGGNWPQFQKQVVSHLPPDANLTALSLLPTCGTKFYRYKDGWDLLYSEDFGREEKEAILAALKSVVASSGVAASRTWGEVIEDRGSQITFSALGQEAPLDAKKKWDPDFAKRIRMKALLGALIPQFSVRLGGTTSIDITKPGIDKAYGIRKLRDLLGISIEEMIFIGDALFPGGNDYPAKEAGVVSVQVRDSLETKRLIETILACSSGVSRAGDDASDTLKHGR
jgi:phosphomannomutase